jgi:hypothetical protein
MVGSLRVKERRASGQFSAELAADEGVTGSGGFGTGRVG